MNLLFITTDQHRFDYMGFLNRTPVRTPHIDALAHDGAVHANAYSVNPLCMPARCSLLTGLYSHQHGVNDNRGDLSRGIATLPQALQKLGYQTAMIGKIHFYEGVPDHLNLTRCRQEVKRLGFDDTFLTSGKAMALYCEDDWTAHLQEKGLLEKYRGDVRKREKANGCDPTDLTESDTVDALTCRKAEQYIRRHSCDQPFFLWLSFCNPHPPFDPLKELHESYRGMDFPAPAGSEKVEGIFRQQTPSYAALVEQVDGYIGRVIHTLKEKGLFDETLIVFTADHGEMLGDHGLQGKAYPFDGSTRVPFIACNRKLIKPGSYDVPVEITDVAATFLEVAGARDIRRHLPESPSQSLLGVWSGDAFHREYAFFENGSQFREPFLGLCGREWKYVFYSLTGKELLIDRRKDEKELHNAAEKHPDVLWEMRRMLLQRMGSTPPPAPAFWIGESSKARSGHLSETSISATKNP